MLNILFSDLGLSIEFIVVSLLLLFLLIVLFIKKNNWWWSFGGLLISSAVAAAAWQGILISWFRIILFLVGVFLVFHIGWNLYRNLRREPR